MKKQRKKGLKSKGRINSTKGKKLSEEICKKISESHKGLKHSKETRDKMSKSHKGLKYSTQS